jgi:hypothetical protein
MRHIWLYRHSLSRPIWNLLCNYIWTLMLKYGIHLSQSYTKVYMMTSSMFYIQPLHVHLTSSTRKAFVDHYGFMEQIKKLKLKLLSIYLLGNLYLSIVGGIMLRWKKNSCYPLSSRVMSYEFAYCIIRLL